MPTTVRPWTTVGVGTGRSHDEYPCPSCTTSWGPSSRIQGLRSGARAVGGGRRGSGDEPGPPGTLTGPTCQGIDPAFMAAMPRSIALAI